METAGYKTWLYDVLQWVYPPRCPVCGDIVSHKGENVSTREAAVCFKCRNVFRRPGPSCCYRCGRTVAQDMEFCENCAKRQFSYVRAFPVWIYGTHVQKSIAAFKYHDRKEYAVYYGQEFVRMYGELWSTLHIQALIPVPIHAARRRIRGYNQAALFAREIGKRMGIPVYEDFLLRIENTQPQKNLDERQRSVNLRRAFAVDERKRKEYYRLTRVALVDDIYTTGSTVEACTRVLLYAGIKTVYIALVSIVG